MALAYQHFHAMAFKWFPCLFPTRQWHICTQPRHRAAQWAASGAVPCAPQPLELVSLTSPGAALPLPAL